jgi:hypothetical protein
MLFFSISPRPAMKKLSTPLFVCLSVVFFLPLCGVSQTLRGVDASTTTKPQLRVPLEFEANQGQASAKYRFVAHGPTYAVGLSATEIALSLRHSEARDQLVSPGLQSSSELHLQLLGANEGSSVAGLRPKAGVSNYFIGNDPSKWRTNVPHFGQVEIGGVYPGIDLVFYGNPQQLEYDFRVAAGADPRAIRLSAKDAISTTLDADGSLVLATAAGDVRLKRPIAYQEIGGVRQAVQSSFLIGPHKDIQFELGSYDRTKPLIIDPVLSYGVAFGGSDGNQAVAMDVDASGNAYVTGFTCSADFPTTAGNFQNIQSNPALTACQDAFVLKLDPTGSSLIYSDFVGGSGVSAGAHVAVDSAGEAFVTGATSSTDFPLIGNIGPASPVACSIVQAGYTCPDGFVFKLSADGASMIFSTLLGGSQSSGVFQLRLDPVTGDVVVFGNTDSSDFKPVPNTLETKFAGETCKNSVPCFNSFLVGLDPSTGAYRYGTFVGTPYYAFAGGLTFDVGGDIYITGSATPPFSSSFGPVTHTYAPTGATAGGSDLFAVRLHPSGNSLTNVYLTLIQGEKDDAGLSVAIDKAGNAYVVGATASQHLPTTSGVLQPTTAYTGFSKCSWAASISPYVPNPCGTGLVAKLDTTGALTFLTYLGGSTGQTLGEAVGLDSAGNIWLTGVTSAQDFPFTSDAYRPTGVSTTFYNFNPFLAEMSSDGATLKFASPIASYMGQSSDLRIDSSDNVYVTGYASAAPSTPGTYPGNPYLSSLVFNPLFVQKWSPGLAPSITVSATKLTFQPTPYDGVAPSQTITVSNTGQGAAQIAMQLVNGASFGEPIPDAPAQFLESDNCGSSLAAGATCTMTVTFEPNVPDASCTVASGCSTTAPDAILIVQNNGQTGNQKITLSGSTGNGPIVSVSPVPIVFPAQIAGTSSSPQNVQVFNQGDLSLAISNMSIGGPNASEFQLTQSSGPLSPACTASPIGPGLGLPVSCIATVTFTPSATATGTRTATLNITDNAIDSPQSIAISGTVAASGASLNISPVNAVVYGPVAIGATPNNSATVVLTNTSSDTSVQINSVAIAGTNAADFSFGRFLSSNNFPFNLAPGAQANLAFQLTPATGSDGLRTATATFTTTPAIAGLPVVQLSGEVVTNADPTIFTMSTPSPLDFGSVQVGQVSTSGSNFLQIENPGPFPCGGGATTCGAPLTISSFVVGNGDYTLTPNAYSAGNFSYCTNPPLTIPPGNGCDFTISFAPSQAGNRNTTLTINSNDPLGPRTVALLGNGLTLPLGNLSVTALDFGYSAIGTTSSPLTVTLQNTGASSLTVSSAAASANFAVASNTCTGPIAPKATCIVGVTFTPSAAGGFSGTLTLTDSNALNAHQIVTLRGTGAAGPSVRISPSTLNFGNQTVNSTSPAQAIVVNNSGDTAVSFPANALRLSADFVVQNTTCGTSLAVGANCAVNLQFKPSATGVESGSLILSDSARANPQTIGLIGIGTSSGANATSTTLTSSLSPAATGQTVTFAAVVAGTTLSTPAPTGTVTFFDGTFALGSGTLAGAIARFTTSSLAAGMHSITAVYSSDATYAASTSAALSEVVDAPAKVATTTMLASSLNPSITGQSVTFSATVAGTTSNTPLPSGTVSFLDGTTSLGTGTLSTGAVATFTTSALTAGSHSITAVYSADSNYSASISAVLTQVVNTPPKVATTTTVVSTPNPSSVGQSVNFTATVAGTTSNTPAPTGSVTFLNGTNTIGSGTLGASGTASVSTTTLTQGTHSITAQYAGDANYAASVSSALTQTVTAAPSFSIAISPTSLTLTQGATGTATVTATSVNGFNQAANFSCSGLPQFTTCSFSPTSVTPAANGTASSTLTIMTDVATAQLDRAPQMGPSHENTVGLALVGGVGLLAMFRRRRIFLKHARLTSFVLALALLAGIATNIAGCGGNNSAASKTPVGTSTVTVTATAATGSQTGSFTLTVQ